MKPKKRKKKSIGEKNKNFETHENEWINNAAYGSQVSCGCDVVSHKSMCLERCHCYDVDDYYY